MLIRNLRRCAFALRRDANSGRAVEAASVAEEAKAPASHAVSTPPPRGLRRFARLAFEKWLVEYPHIRGSLRQTPALPLNLKPGELVQIRSKDEIVATLDVNNRNRGLSFDGEMVPYCGGTYKVLSRVDRIVDERTGRMLTFPNSCIVLDGVICKACLSRNRLFCPRSTYSYWHEIWLRRAD
jgi:hypothetical protein